MDVLLTGHAGLFISAGPGGATTVLCDPWFNPAYLGAWFPFPDNGDLDVERIASPTYLYVSHLHKDHFDREFLARHVDKRATVLLPEFPLPDLREALEAVGFTRFVPTRDGVPVDLDGVRVMIAAAASPSDGPIGDSVLAVDDGEARLLDQNDCHPRDPAALAGLGPYDLHLLQYSGAIWYPMVYRMEPERKAALAREKRRRQVQRAMGYIRAVGAAHVVPFAGPPAFLDPDLFELNDLHGDPANIFLDQVKFLEAMAGAGMHQGELAVAGTEIRLAPGGFEVSHAVPPEPIFAGKEAYLRSYQQRRKPQLDAIRPRLTAAARGAGELAAALAAWWEPLLRHAPTLRRALGGRLVLDVGAYGVVLDPGEGTVRPWEGEAWEHWLGFDEAVLWDVVERHVTDWVNDLFLSCRFEADRVGGYNEAVFTFFKCLEPRRMAYLEATLAEAERRAEGRDGPGEQETFRCGRWVIGRRCPHLGADLSRFGRVEGGTITCTLHGRTFDLDSGRCLNGIDPPLFTRPATDAPVR
ncbi:MAG: Rieske 2Fe-2S domain-containing protein [Acidimicrobiales bacterium]